MLREFTGRDCDVASNPEFLKEGAAIDDFMKPDRVVVGVRRPEVAEVLHELYEPFLRTETAVPGDVARERGDDQVRGQRACWPTKISFINEMANLCERIGRRHQRRAPRHRPRQRIGFQFLFPGVGLRRQLLSQGRPGARRPWPRSTASSRAMLRGGRRGERARRSTCCPRRSTSTSAASSAGKTIAVWGLAFKPRTDDIREAPALVLIDRLLAAGRKRARPRPRGDGERAGRSTATSWSTATRRTDALEGADALAIVTEWKEFRTPDFDVMKQLMKSAGDLRRPQPVRAGADEAPRLHVLQHRPADGVRKRSAFSGQRSAGLSFRAKRRSGRHSLPATWCVGHESPATVQGGATIDPSADLRMAVAGQGSRISLTPRLGGSSLKRRGSGQEGGVHAASRLAGMLSARNAGRRCATRELHGRAHRRLSAAGRRRPDRRVRRRLQLLPHRHQLS